jgi:glyoxylase-like metal-dependent hydrolase (beta-lactamase superfamily II)
MLRTTTVKRLVTNTGVRIYRIPCEALPDLPGRVYLLVGAGPPTLVDTGTGKDGSRQILDGLEAVRREFGEPVSLREIRRIVVTHGHFDHIGGLAELRRQLGAAVGAHPLDRRVIEAWDERSVLGNHAMRRFLENAGVGKDRQDELIRAFGFARGRVESVPVDFLLDDGQEFDGVRVVHVPGHAAGHVCLVVGNVMLTGDHVLLRTVPQQWPESIAPYTGLGHYLESLDRVRRIEGIELALGGHEPPIRDFYQRCDEIRQSHMRRLERLLEILRTAPEPPTIDQMAEQMYSHPKSFFAMLALTDVGSRVEYLEQRGRLAIANLDEVARDPTAAWRYRVAEAK